MDENDVIIVALAVIAVVIGFYTGDWQTILSGVLSGITIAFFGYAKSVTEEGFDPKKALQTMFIGAVVGGVAGYYGWTYEQAYEWLSSMGLITVIEYVKKALIRIVKRLLS